jgi:hypothetical protein
MFVYLHSYFLYKQTPVTGKMNVRVKIFIVKDLFNRFDDNLVVNREKAIKTKK